MKNAFTGPARPPVLDRSALGRAASLARPLRLELYEYVGRQGRPVGREEAANALGVSRALAAFHLDRLVRDGLLAVEFRRLTGRSGPGAGRPAKLYRRGPRVLELSVPRRNYQLAAEVLAAGLEAIDDQGVSLAGSTGSPVAGAGSLDALAGSGPAAAAGSAVSSAAFAAGRRIGRSRASTVLPSRQQLIALLDDLGFEPRPGDGGTVELGNCPFDGLRADHGRLVCAMNRSLLDGLLEGSSAEGLATRVDPGPGRCCVTLAPD